MNIKDFLNSIEFGKEKESSLDDILKEAYSLAFPYRIEEDVSLSLLCPKCKGTVDYYADALRGGPEGSEEAIEWRCPECGYEIKGSDYGNGMEEDASPFEKSASIWGSHPPRRSSYLVPKEKVHEPEVLPKHYKKNRDALMQVLNALGVPEDSADEIIRNSESPESKEKIKRVIFKVLTTKYGLPETEAQEFMDTYGDADVDDMIKGVASILGRAALPGGGNQPRLDHLREDSLEEGFGSAKKNYVDTKKLHRDPKQGIRILKMLAKKDPTYPAKGKYIEWMAKTYPSMPSMTKYDVIAKFHQFCELNQIENKDINAYQNIEQVDDAVRQAEIKYAEKKGEAKTKSGLYKDLEAINAKIQAERDPEKKEKLTALKDKIAAKINDMKDFLKDIEEKDLIFKNDNVVVVRPETIDKSCKYGRGSRWCTAASGSRNYFNSYYFGRGVNLYYIIPLIEMNNDKFDKIAVAVYPNGEKEYYDAHDGHIDAETFKTIRKKLAIP